MNKQQDFLATLKDPVKTYLELACRDFHEEFKNSIRDVILIKDLPVSDEYTVSVESNNFGNLITTIEILIDNYLKKNLPNLIVSYSPIEEKGSLFVRHYYIRMP